MIESQIFWRMRIHLLWGSLRPGRIGGSIFVQPRGPLRDIICGRLFPNLHDAGPQPWPAPSVASGDLPAFASSSPALEHHLSQRDDGPSLDEKFSINL